MLDWRLKTKWILEAGGNREKDHPFKIGKIPFQLKVFGFGTDTILRIYLKDKIEFDSIKAKIGETIKEYNEISEKI